MFELHRQKVRVDSVNPRAEKHGEAATVLALDVFMSLTVANAVLGLFDSQLQQALFTKGGDTLQPELEGIEPVSEFPALRFPKIGAVKWSEEFPGYALRVHLGLDESEDLAFEQATFDRFSFDPKQGGSVFVRFRAIVHPTSSQTAGICELIQRDVEVSAIAPLPAESLNLPQGENSSEDFAAAAKAAIEAHADRTGKGKGKRGQQGSAELAVVFVVVVVLGLIAALMFGLPQYRVYSQRLTGEAELARANFSKQVAVQEAIAKRDSSRMLADAEVERAKGVAAANRIIGDSLRGNTEYLRYLFVNGLEHTQNQVIYVPTEAQLPILEATRLAPKPAAPAPN